ncbi:MULTISPECIES: hypothetical protein [Chryseobacterium]|jgi:hypothetical protein|uniref:Uncharacterized protein n=1 Tax=Chryseobacterium aquaticum TaxID=452084 RepID=A0A0Q3KRE8_9FLAO|nr:MULTISPECIES: hypothetical protein [Chryseobacterium]KNB62033.1 hypothetical protein AC804_03815 [Chryseobacterium sp. Hurlbut01]KQK26892.1 hypothetical protein AR438_01330 [Chryseobacterium aquaticum]
MNYYIIVDKIKDNHESGIYGRRKLTKDEKKNAEFNDVLSIFIKTKNGDSNLFTNILKSVFKPFPVYALELIDKAKEKYNQLNFVPALTIQENIQEKIQGKKILIFKDSLLDNNYNIDKENDLFYGFFSNTNGKKISFEKIMKSYGGATMSIVERNSVNKIHFGGVDGKFSYGIYCEHPKNSEVLLPLNNTAEIIERIILEEIISAYEALGAKRIKIFDVSHFSNDLKASRRLFSISSEYNSNSLVLREKEFGKGTFDPDRAKKDKVFIFDYPNVITTINARIYGNQILEKFTEQIDLSGGLEIDLLSMFSLSNNFNYKRHWQFEVEFYDKNDF